MRLFTAAVESSAEEAVHFAAASLPDQWLNRPGPVYLTAASWI